MRIFQPASRSAPEYKAELSKRDTQVIYQPLEIHLFQALLKNNTAKKAPWPGLTGLWLHVFSVCRLGQLPHKYCLTSYLVTNRLGDTSSSSFNKNTSVCFFLHAEVEVLSADFCPFCIIMNDLSLSSCNRLISWLGFLLFLIMLKDH